MSKRYNFIRDFWPLTLILILTIAVMAVVLDCARISQELFDFYIKNIAVSSQLDQLSHTYVSVAFRQNIAMVLLLAIFVVAVFLSYINAKHAKAIREHSKRLEEVNSALDMRYAAMEMGLDGVMIIDPTGKLHYVNKRFLQILGMDAYAYSEYLEHSWLEIFPSQLQDTILAEAIAVIEHGDSWSGEYSLNIDGEERYFELTLHRLPDDGFIATNKDITDQRRSDSERAELQTQFYQAQKMEAIGRLAGGVAHDFNNILSAITSYTEFLIEDLEEMPDQRKFATKIMLAADQAKKLVDQILTFSRKNDAFAEHMDLKQIVEENISMMEASAPPTVTIESNIDVKDAHIIGSSTQISQTLMNLCVNGVDALEGQDGVLRIDLMYADQDFCKAKGIFADTVLKDDDKNIMVKLEEGKQDGQTIMRMGVLSLDKEYVCVSVSDTGSGMSYDLMEKAFEPFFTTKSTNKGTGLGLSTVQGVVAQNKGAMVVETIVGVGSRFLLFFPLEAVDVNAFLVPGQGDAPLMFDGARALLVEDHKIVAETTQKCCKEWGSM